MYLYYIYISNTSKYLASNIPLPQSRDEKIHRSPLSKSRCTAISFIVQLVMSAAITLLNTFNRQRIGRGSHFRSARIRGEVHGPPSGPRGNAVEPGLRILSYVDGPLITGRARAYGIQWPANWTIELNHNNTHIYGSLQRSRFGPLSINSLAGK